MPNIQKKNWDTATSLCERPKNAAICQTASEIVQHATGYFLKCEWSADRLVQSGDKIVKRKGSDACHVAVDFAPSGYRIVP